MHRSLASLALSFVLATVAPCAPSRAAADGPVVVGISAEGGGFLGDVQGALGGVAVRLGVRPLPWLSVYAQSHGLAGVLTSGPRGGSAQGVLWNTAMIGTHLGPLHLAGGPSLDFAWGCGEQAGCIRGAPLFGLDARAALHLDPLVVSIDVHPTWISGEPVVGMVGGLGWEL
ncbi:MAG: hypothetical protein M3Y87_00245 [Myxococcota bacterium]|nr:hypothetical protein [Myxococcota bacterium]